MKTSFYFVLWIAIYPILDLMGLSENSFIIALFIIFGLSWLLNSRFSNLSTYERLMQSLPIMEDVFTGNIGSIYKRLTREFVIETITAIYLLIATAIMAYMVFALGSSETFALIIFGFISVGVIIRSNKLYKALSSIKSDPSMENCADIVDKTYQLNYASYHEARQDRCLEELLPLRPKFYTPFKVLSFIFAIACTILGALFIVFSLIPMILEGFSITGLFFTMRFLYGSLALYFGIKDLVSILTARN